jgi:hypothetical protein
LDARKINLESRRISRKNVNGLINLVYDADTAILGAIGKAKRVGVGLQQSPNAAFFSGFDSMPFEEGAGKLPGLLRVCERTR